MKRMTAALAILVASMMLVGCSSNEKTATKRSANKTPTYSSQPSTVAPQASETNKKKSGKTNERGNVVKQIGEQGASFSNKTNEDFFTFKVNSITPNLQCNSGFSQPPENGQYMGINLTLTGGPGVAEVGTAVHVNSQDFQIVGLDGVVENGTSGAGTAMCLSDADSFPQQVGQGVTGTGTIVVDTAQAAGYLVFRPAILGSSVGWEYKF